MARVDALPTLALWAGCWRPAARAAQKLPGSQVGIGKYYVLPALKKVLSQGPARAQVSAEFCSLCAQQLELLLSALHTSLLAAAQRAGQGQQQQQQQQGQQQRPPAGSEPGGGGGAGEGGSGAGGDGNGSEEGALLAADLVTGTSLSCCVYARAPLSIQQGSLECRLVAAGGGGAGGAGGGSGGGGPARADHQQALLLGRGPYSTEDEEAWIIEQSVIVLPDSGECSAAGCNVTRCSVAGCSVAWCMNESLGGVGASQEGGPRRGLLPSGYRASAPLLRAHRRALQRAINMARSNMP